MMRWLKDKKRGEKKGGTHDDADKEEDDYGFEKEKTPNKSPVIKRELPPTPAAPEEKSTHIYEEIPDLHVSCTPESERTSLLKNKKQGRAKATSSNHSHKGGILGKSASGVDGSSLDDSISPYMVVPVDEEVRQTPPHFHRDGTPEVHCDLIVKETHCEILLTRKPKVGAFRLDSTALTGSENGVGATHGIRNNTHFCSWNRRASVDVQAGGGESKGASAFSWSSSAFSSASTSRVNSMGTSSMSLSTLPEHRLQSQGQSLPSTLNEGDSAGGSSGSSAKGVMTYSTASNFIPRSTKLVFKPLTPLDPDFFDDPEQDIALRNAELACQGQIPNSKTHSPDNENDSIKYASVQGQEITESGSPVVYSAIQNDQLYGSQQVSTVQGQTRGQCEPATPPSLQEIRKCQPMSDIAFRSTLIRPYSPSSSSSCTYASVNFPPESRLYNTIQDIDLPDASSTCFPLTPPRPPSRGDGEPNFANYTSGTFDGETTKYPGTHSNRVDLSHQNSNFPIQHADGNNIGDRAGHTSHRGNGDSVIYSGIVNQCDLNTDTTYACIDANKEETLANHTTSSLLQNKMNGELVLDFCRCQEYQQYSSCGCSDVKADDDDNASVATTTNELKGSCSGCGRLIKQITYSESYSDETYEHAYSSRLLLRKGRRFSSPDISMSEISNSESQDLNLIRQGGSPFGSMSRDDMWSRPHACDVRSTFYRPDGDLDSCSAEQFSSTDHSVVPVLNAREREHLPLDTLKKNSNEPDQLPVHRKSFCAFSHNDLGVSPKTGSMKPPGVQNLKRTSLPLNIAPSSLVNSESRSNKSSAVSQLQPKSSAFSGLFSKFSRPKVNKSIKTGDEFTENCQQTCITDSNEQTVVEAAVKTNSPSINPIPEKNTLKLSKFFQRLSTKETDPENQTSGQNSNEIERKSGPCDDIRVGEFPHKLMTPETQQDQSPTNNYKTMYKHDKNTDSFAEVANASKNFCVKSNSNSNNKNNSNNNNNNTNNNNNNNNNSNNNNNNTAINKINSNKIGTGASDISNKNNTTLMDIDTPEAITVPRRQHHSSGQINHSVLEEAAACFSPTSDTGSKPKAKTDSGDTCYEYDISTSSESEQTSYEYFLSKVKKSLNLEKEVQHIADMNALRRKLLCKLCKKGFMSSSSGVSPEQCDMCGVDGACAHAASFKCSDWRKFFGELVVDQRAAILDCLTDYAHSPYTVKGDGLFDSNHCRECGGEIMTSDSESLTTVYSILSQHLRMTSPGARTPSCDSDEGTMADNSCESGDDDKNGGVQAEDSSGFDDDDVPGKSNISPVEEVPRAKAKKREKSAKDKREKKVYSHSSLERTRRRSQSSMAKEDVLGHHLKKGQYVLGSTIEDLGDMQSLSHEKTTSKRAFAGDNKKPHNIGSNSSSCNNLSSIPTSTNSSTTYMTFANELGSDSKKTAETTRAKTSLLATDKAIQDIYAPLPSKALSWLTTRNGGQHNTHCACSRNSTPASGDSIQNASTDASSSIVVEREEMERSEVNTNLKTAKTEIVSKVQQIGETTLNQKPKTDLGNNLLQEDSRVQKSVPDIGSETPSTSTKKVYLDSDSADLSCKSSTGQSKQSPVLNLARRRSRQLPLAALDLLPETAFGSDVTEQEASTQKVTTTKNHPIDYSEITSSPPKKSPKPRLVERMTRLFENNNANTGILTKDSKLHSNACDAPTSSPSTTIVKDAQTSRFESEGESKFGRKKLLVDAENKASASFPNVHASRHERTLSLGTSKPLAPKARTTMSQSNQTNVALTESPGVAKSQATISSKLETRIPNESRNDMTYSCYSEDKKTCRRSSLTNNENKSRNREHLPRRQAAPPSPGSSSSSSSSSSSRSRRRGGLKGAGHVSVGQTKPRRLSKKSYSLSHKVKSKSTERKKKKKRDGGGGGGGKEEKTYYCFSSDISDIDVMEVEDFEPYASHRAESKSRQDNHSNKERRHRNTVYHGASKDHKPRKDRSASRSRDSASGGRKNHVAVDISKNASAEAERKLPRETEKNDEGDYDMVQEIYSMPPNSSEVCEVKGYREDGPISPSASPEMRKLRKKSKRTDIYKTKKSNNRLLSDLIIRNYDRQVFGNV